MNGVNKAIILGHLGGDPDIRRTQDGRPVASFSVATGEQWRDKATGERKERTDWHRVVVFNENLCKVVEQYLRKGSKVYVEGAMQTRKWTDQGGQDRYVTEIVLKAFNAQIMLLDRREGVPAAGAESDYGAARGGDGARDRHEPGGPGTSAGGKPPIDDEIPF